MHPNPYHAPAPPPSNKSVLVIPHNRLRLVMAHTTRYAFKGEARLALDAGVSKSAVSRLVNGLSSPSFAVVSAIAHALEERLGRSLDPRELVSFDGNYPTPSACALCGCRGCSLSQAGVEHSLSETDRRPILEGR